MSKLDGHPEFTGVDLSETKREAEQVLQSLLEFVENNPNFRVAAFIAAAVDGDTGQLYAEEVSLVDQNSRDAILDAIKEGGAADDEEMATHH